MANKPAQRTSTNGLTTVNRQRHSAIARMLLRLRWARSSTYSTLASGRKWCNPSRESFFVSLISPASTRSMTPMCTPSLPTTSIDFVGRHHRGGSPYCLRKNSGAPAEFWSVHLARPNCRGRGERDRLVWSDRQTTPPDPRKTSPPEYGSQFSFAVPEITNELLKGIQAAGPFH